MEFGLDFLTKYKTFINYEDCTLTIRIPVATPLTIPIIDSPDRNRFSLILPARSEVIRKIDINDDYILIPNQRLSNHVYVARTIVHRLNPRIKIMSTHTEVVTPRGHALLRLNGLNAIKN